MRSGGVRFPYQWFPVIWKIILYTMNISWGHFMRSELTLNNFSQLRNPKVAEILNFGHFYPNYATYSCHSNQWVTWEQHLTNTLPLFNELPLTHIDSFCVKFQIASLIQPKMAILSIFDPFALRNGMRNHKTLRKSWHRIWKNILNQKEMEINWNTIE